MSCFYMYAKHTMNTLCIKNEVQKWFLPECDSLWSSSNLSRLMSSLMSKAPLPFHIRLLLWFCVNSNLFLPVNLFGSRIFSTEKASRFGGISLSVSEELERWWWRLLEPLLGWWWPLISLGLWSKERVKSTGQVWKERWKERNEVSWILDLFWSF